MSANRLTIISLSMMESIKTDQQSQKLNKAKNMKTPVAIITIPNKPPDQPKAVMFAEEESKESKSSSTSFEMPAKRSKSEASKENMMTLIERARKNLMRSRKLSPNKLDAQIRQRQERAENLRQSI